MGPAMIDNEELRFSGTRDGEYGAVSPFSGTLDGEYSTAYPDFGKERASVEDINKMFREMLTGLLR